MQRERHEPGSGPSLSSKSLDEMPESVEVGARLDDRDEARRRVERAKRTAQKEQRVWNGTWSGRQLQPDRAKRNAGAGRSNRQTALRRPERFS